MSTSSAGTQRSTHWTGGSGAWTETPLWSAGVPDGETAVIFDGSQTAIVSGSGTAEQVTVENTTTLQGMITIDAISDAAALVTSGSGALTIGADAAIVAAGTVDVSYGTLITIDGFLQSDQVVVAGQVTIPAVAGSSDGRWTIAGKLDDAGGVITLGNSAQLNTTDGLIIEKGGSLVLGQDTSVIGTLTLDDGYLYSQERTAGDSSVSFGEALTLAGTSDTIHVGLNDPISLTGPISGSTTGGLKITGTGTVDLDGQNSFSGGVLIDQKAELILSSTAAAGSGSIRFVPATASTDPLPLTVAGVIGGTAAVLGALDLSDSGFGLGNGINITNLQLKTTANTFGGQVTATYDSTTGKLTVLGDTSLVATIALPKDLDGMFSIASDGDGGTTLTLVHGSSDAVAIATRSDVAAHDYGVSGSGVTVGIISDSFNAQGGLYQDVEDGALPQSVLTSYDPVLDHRVGDDEGRAMAQLVYDVAPNATLKFATASGTGTVDHTLAAAIDSLIDAHAQVIVDDIGGDPGSFYSLEPETTAAIQRATELGITMVTSATNRSDVFYEHALQVTSGTLIGSSTPENIYNFGTAAIPQYYQEITLQNDYTNNLSLQWVALSGSVSMTAHFFTKSGDTYTPLPLGPVPGDHGLRYALPALGTGGTTELYVAFTTDQTAPDGIFKYIIGPASDPPAEIGDGSTPVGSGTITGHQLDPNEITVAAADYRNTLPGSVLQNEDFSAAGPGILYAAPDGSLYASPHVLSKPDITAPDHTSTTVTAPTATLPDGVGGLSTFSGTSAAAPAFAGVAALMLQADPSLTGNDIRNLTADSAIAMTNPTVAGAGLVQADLAVGYAKHNPIVQFVGGNTRLLGTGGNDSIVTNSGATTVDGGAGSDTISAGGQSTSIMGGSGHLLVNVTSGSVSLSGGTGSATVTGGTGDLLIGGSAGDNMLTGGGGGAIWGGGTADLLVGGVGDLIGTAASGNSTLVGGNGNLFVAGNQTLSFTANDATVFSATSGGQDTVVGTGSFEDIARGGQTTVFGGTGNGVTWAGASLVTDVAGAGPGTLVAGTGHADLWIGATSGAQTLLAVNQDGGGSIDVFGFRHGIDSFSSAGYAAGSSTATTRDGSLTLVLSDHTSITFVGVAALA